jgi:hypothetical protein
MPRDPGLEELINDELRDIRGVTGKAMFGGWAWLLHGNLLCGARVDSLMVRLGKGHDAWALAVPGITPVDMQSRRMSGWVRANADAFADDALRAKLIAAAVTFASALPRK